MPTCAECQAWLHDKDWKRTKRGGPGGRDLPRPPGTPLPCVNPKACPKSSDGQPHPEKDLTPRVWRAYRAYLAFKAGAPCPTDAVVRWYVGLFEYAAQIAERSQRAEEMAALTSTVLTIAQMGGSRGRRTRS